MRYQCVRPSDDVPQGTLSSPWSPLGEQEQLPAQNGRVCWMKAAVTPGASKHSGVGRDPGTGLYCKTWLRTSQSAGAACGCCWAWRSGALEEGFLSKAVKYRQVS